VSAIGFKILVDLIASCKRPVVLREVPYRFRQREHGESKLDTLVLVEYLQLVADKMVGQWIPPRFILFGAVGLVGAVLYLTLLALFYRGLQMDFRSSLVVATLAAMTSNFLLNNMITYRDRRLKGVALITGLLTFYLACSIGALVSVRVSEMVAESGLHWLLAGAAGIFIASIWNYSMTQFFTWRVNRSAQEKRRALTRVA
jgi:dolichol-phosphate mannosyltransferase